MRTALAFTALLALAGCSSAPPEEATEPRVKPLDSRQIAPGFELKDANGATAKLSDYAGKVVVLNFWATWCGPCRIEMPWFAEFERKYKDRGFALLGVSLDEEGWDVVKPYLAEHKDVTYRILMGDPQLADIYGGIASLPTTFLIDRDGRIASIHTSLVSKSTYVKEIEALLENKTQRGAISPLAIPARTARFALLEKPREPVFVTPVGGRALFGPARMHVRAN